MQIQTHTLRPTHQPTHTHKLTLTSQANENDHRQTREPQTHTYTHSHHRLTNTHLSPYKLKQKHTSTLRNLYQPTHTQTHAQNHKENFKNPKLDKHALTRTQKTYALTH